MLNKIQTEEIETLLRNKIESKLANYERETGSMPFLAKLMQDSEKVAAYSFIHSLSTMLGISLYEEIAKIVAKENYDEVETSYDVEGFISPEENAKIAQILQETKSGKRDPDKEKETKEILECGKKNSEEHKIRADLFLKKDEEEYYVEIKTAKPNMDVFAKSKQKLLEWIALRKKKVNTLLAIPYNPYHPEPYERFTMKRYIGGEKDLLVGEDFWKFLGGEGTYGEILDIFDQVGKEFEKNIKTKINEIAKEKMDL